MSIIQIDNADLLAQVDFLPIHQKDSVLLYAIITQVYLQIVTQENVFKYVQKYQVLFIMQMLKLELVKLLVLHNHGIHLLTLQPIRVYCSVLLIIIEIEHHQMLEYVLNHAQIHF